MGSSLSVEWILAMLELTAGLKVPLTPPVALRMVYCLTTLPPGRKIVLTVAPPSVATPLTLARPAFAAEIWIM